MNQLEELAEVAITLARKHVQSPCNDPERASASELHVMDAEVYVSRREFNDAIASTLYSLSHSVGAAHVDFQYVKCWREIVMRGRLVSPRERVGC